MGRKQYDISELRDIVSSSKSLAGVLRALGLRPVGGNYRTIKRLLADNDIDISHFTGQGWNVGLGFKPNRLVADADIFVRDSQYKCSWRLRERYKKYTGINHCENCGLRLWLDKPIPLEIHHVNGDNTDNRLENLRLLCPNCHAFTDNYRGRAHLSALSERRDVECRKFKEALTGKADGNLEPSLLIVEEGAETRHDTPKTFVMVKE